MTNEEITALTYQLFLDAGRPATLLEPSMTAEQITTLYHFIHPSDFDKMQQLTFSLAELESLHGMGSSTSDARMRNVTAVQWHMRP